MKEITKAVEKNRQLILDSERYIWNNPETGYKEIKTSAYMEKIFKDLGYELVIPGDIPGFYTVIDTGRPGPEILIFGELDSLICPTHPECDKETGAVHACGHNAQCAALIGIAAALKEEGILDKFSGKIRLCAVPAEELIEIEYRKELINQGKIKYYGGKSEFLRRGYFDGVDLAFMVHTGIDFMAKSSAVGCIAKEIIYKGKAAHAGGVPWNGINALYAATQGLSSANALRETFKEKDCIRFHPIITHGGEVVNAIPETVKIESYIRGSNFEGMIDANKRVNRALTGSALSIGANIEINDFPGYAPLVNNKEMINVAKEASEMIEGAPEFKVLDVINTGSTDMGDISSVMPAIHPYVPGIKGTSHGNDFYIGDPELACVLSTKFQMAMLLVLMGNGAEKAKQIVADFKPSFASKEEYFDYIEKIYSQGDRITYKDNDTCEVRL